MTAHAIWIREYGGTEVMRFDTAMPGEPGPGQALVSVRAIGVNFMDISTREGYNPGFELPGVLGVEGAGVVAKLGEGVSDLQVGQRVAWYYIPGSYTDQLLASAADLVPVPDEIDDETAAAVLMQGLTAQHLSHYARPGDTVLVHSAAGGVGSLLTQLLVAAGSTVIARVSTQEKVAAARAAGAEYLLIGRGNGFATQVRGLTNGRGTNAVFDGTGADTYHDSLASLATHGAYVYYGGADDQPEPVLLTQLPRSIVQTHPVVMDHVPTQQVLRTRSAELFTAVASGSLKVTVGGSYPLALAADAHRALKSRSTVGKLLLHP